MFFCFFFIGRTDYIFCFTSVFFLVFPPHSHPPSRLPSPTHCATLSFLHQSTCVFQGLGRKHLIKNCYSLAGSNSSSNSISSSSSGGGGDGGSCSSDGDGGGGSSNSGGGSST